MKNAHDALQALVNHLESDPSLYDGDDDGELGRVIQRAHDALKQQQTCRYCGGNCPNEPDDSEYLCDGYAGDIDGLYQYAICVHCDGSHHVNDDHQCKVGE